MKWQTLELLYRKFIQDNMVDVCLKKTEVVIYQQWIEKCHRNLVCRYISTFLIEESQKNKIRSKIATPWSPS